MTQLGMNYAIGFLILLLAILLWKTHIDFQKN